MRFAWLVLFATAACAPVVHRPGAPAATAQRPDAADSSCVAALDTMAAFFQRDYPGYRVKVRGREAELAALTDSVRAIARTSEHHSVCVRQALQPWMRFFRDPHIMVWQAAPPPPPSTAAQPAPAAAPADDPDRPSLTHPDDSTAVLRIPDLDWSYKPAIDSLLAANLARLLATPYLVVDVRGNGGGATSSYAGLIPLLYTRPIHQYGADIWASEGNMAMMREWIADPTLPAGDREQARAVLARMEARPNRFVPYAEGGMIRRDRVHALPRRVAVLVDGGCKSSCEDLVIAALQSDKVTVLGTRNTGGVHDYGNVRSVWLPGWRRLRVPTSRSRRMLAEGPLDMVGIPPQVLIPPAETDAVAFARRYLRSADPARPGS
ncbi:MAG: hypothetical protein AVDCRST_MAG68-5640 [uncultured Gemmatimonadetes bacterium]|uniref:Tail specific protease domain-containing protein n=1 Tax=uncultured Gemmatimonadota bacterium TaxID=203437 RepID=A0A6J4N0E0_9BACT|nr:MAG: hypothetical protein AVDCRST_MAG68-5640 [uncultured Gemmatimonadota bacterium]